jgi:starch synthase
MSRILMVTAEAAPFAKTGGLADVLGALPKALAQLGEEVAVLMPRYDVAKIPGAERIWNAMPIVLGPFRYTAAIDQVVQGGVRYMFVDCPTFYSRGDIYGNFGDNHLRFALLNLAAVHIARHIFRADIFHGHDWPAGLLPVYLRENFGDDPTFFGAKSVLTIHNLGYQGNFPAHLLGDLGLDLNLFHSEGLEFWGQVSFMKAGILWSDAITTVSPTYAREIQTPEYGYSMDGLLRPRSAKITGILNGADYTEWNPGTDPHIPKTYSAKNLAGKRTTKKALLEELGLPVQLDRMLIGIVSRFADQKGLDLIAAIAKDLTEENVAVVALGSGDARFEEMFRELSRDFPETFAAHIGYDNALAHRIEAGADAFLMPSRYEPCGLSQLYSLRYGTVPIVRATGGLDDTVEPETGFKFGDYSPAALLGAIREALAVWKDQKAWQSLIRRGMAKDFSWDASAREYKKLYESLTSAH